MTIEAGQTLLHYRLIEKIGEGGMGAVWKALDTTLDREVAIKVLPDVFVQDAERLARFEREAKVLASLNHPNVAAIYGLHQADTSTGSVRFLAMELVSGSSLADRLGRGRMPVGEALDIAAQIALALEEAHSRGVIHRDLKPANVVLDAADRPKVLDFGLAKMVEPVASDSGATDFARSPTVTSAGTIAGVILGTAAYMSPEQARGKPVDTRTDLWSFGCVLFEMLSGAQPFKGETVTDLLAAIIQREPDWDALPEDVPVGIRRLVALCLRRRPSKRLRDAGDAQLLIEEIRAGSFGEAASHASRSGGRAGPRAGAVVATAALALIAGVLAGWTIRQEPTQELPLRKFTIPLSVEDASFVALSGPKISPDGNRVLYRDSRYVAYVSDESGRRQVYLTTFPTPGKIWQVSTTGGEFPEWRGDGRELFFANRDAIYALDVNPDTGAPSGAPRLLFRRPVIRWSSNWTDGYHVSADGQRFIVAESARAEDAPDPAIVVVQNWFAQFQQDE